jgi:transcriptional regulator with XRE-family HTH domain
VEGTPYTGDLDLDAVSTRDDLVALLRIVHIRADKPSLRTLEARTRHSATPLSKTAVAEMLKGIRFPRKSTMLSFLHVCGVADDEMWQRAWERVVAGKEGMASSRAIEASHSVGPTPSIEQDTPQVTVDSRWAERTGQARDDRVTTEENPSVDAARMRWLEDENKRLRAQLVATRQEAIEPPRSDDSASDQRPRSPVVSRRELGALLRALRVEKKMAVEQVAENLLCSPDKVRRMENGFRSGTVRDVRDLCGLYGVTEAAQRDRLMELAREAKQQGWWQSYDLPYSDYIGLEVAAAVSRIFHSSVVPGILQTADYARELHVQTVPPLSAELIDQGVEARLIRQRRLTETNPLRLWSVLDEAALQRVVGGPAVMRGQLERLIEVASLPYVTIQIIPFEAGAHPALESNFTILEFAGPMSGVVYVEGLIGSFYLNRSKDIERYRLVFDVLSGVAYNQEESIRKIADISKILKRRSSSRLASLQHCRQRVRVVFKSKCHGRHQLDDQALPGGPLSWSCRKQPVGDAVRSGGPAEL